jgi:homogentisate 1,2-dioxygenase
MTPQQFEALKDWIEAVVYSATSDPHGNSNGKLYRVQEDRARELFTGAEADDVVQYVRGDIRLACVRVEITAIEGQYDD